MKSSNFFVNCDMFLITKYESMVKFHKENGNVIIMGCTYKNMNRPYGVIEMGANCLIESMKEKKLVNTGTYIVKSELIDYIEDGVHIGFPDMVENECQKGKKTEVFLVGKNEWMDMREMLEHEKIHIKLYGE